MSVTIHPFDRRHGVALFVAFAALLLSHGDAIALDPGAARVWNHSSAGDLEGWATPTGSLFVRDGMLRLDVAARSLSLLGPEHIAVDAASLTRLEIDLSIDPPDRRVGLYWTDDAKRGFRREWSVPVATGRSTLDLSPLPGWRGTIDRLFIVPEKGVRRVEVRSIALLPKRSAAGKLGETWNDFFRIETRAGYTVNTFHGAHVGPVPFTLILGGGAILLFIAGRLVGRRREGSGAKRARALLVGAALLFAARGALDQVRVAAQDEKYFRGRTTAEKIAMLNPPGFFPLLEEGNRLIPPGEGVELRAKKPFPWEKGGYYLYPRKVEEKARWVISYRTAAPADSVSMELLFRRKGIGSIYGRGAP